MMVGSFLLGNITPLPPNLTAAGIYILRIVLIYCIFFLIMIVNILICHPFDNMNLLFLSFMFMSGLYFCHCNLLYYVHVQ